MGEELYKREMTCYAKDEQCGWLKDPNAENVKT